MGIPIVFFFVFAAIVYFEFVVGKHIFLYFSTHDVSVERIYNV